MKKIYTLAICLVISFSLQGQEISKDTVVVELAKTSKLMLTMEDRSDLEVLKHYDFQALFDDILSQLEGEESKSEMESEEESGWDEEDGEGEYDEEDENEDPEDENDWDEDDVENDDENEDDEEDEDDDEGDWKHRLHHHSRIFGMPAVDFGINNYENFSGFTAGQDAQYAVRPWGSWYVALNSLYPLRISGNFKIELGYGISWYNFKFQDDRTMLTEGPDAVIFSRNDLDANHIKSKFTVSHINISFVPVFDFGTERGRERIWRHHDTDFRIGAGVYAGYRIGSYTKQVYEIQNEKEKIRERDNFYLNNFRYGLRLQLGIHATDFFVNFDLNELFRESKGPDLNAYSFGIIF